MSDKMCKQVVGIPMGTDIILKKHFTVATNT